MNDSEKQVKTNQFPCSACGGNMNFDAKTQMLRCPYCDAQTAIPVENYEIKEYDLESADELASKDWGTETRVARCQRCGAQTIFDPQNTSQNCAFCGSPQVAQNEESAGIVPESLIPFKITKNTAIDAFGQWIKSLKFIPNALKSNYQARQLTGVYIPYWTYDTDTSVTYTAEAGYHYTVEETVWEEDEKGNKTAVTKYVTKTRWEDISGQYGQYFDDVPINASAKMDVRMIKKVEPFELKDLVPYTPEYLSGFVAERYSISLKNGWEKAKAEIESDLTDKIGQSIDADEVRNLTLNISYTNVKFKHILLPIWISAYIYKDKIYQFLVNGQSGKTNGDSPTSYWKVASLIAAVLTIILIIFSLSSCFSSKKQSPPTKPPQVTGSAVAQPPPASAPAVNNVTNTTPKDKILSKDFKVFDQEYNSLSGSQKDAWWKNNKGSYVQWQGLVTDIKSDTIYLRLRSGPSPNAEFTMAASQKGKMSSIKKGETITIKGSLQQQPGATNLWKLTDGTIIN